MPDVALGFDTGGNTVYRRDDGTHYVVDPFLLVQPSDCIAPGQTVAPRASPTVPVACPTLIGVTSDPTIGEAYLEDRLSILNYLPQTPLGTPLETRLYDTANSSGVGLLPLLEAQTQATLDTLKATLDAEAERQKQLYVFPALAALQAGKEASREGGSFDVLSAVKTVGSFVANPVGTYVQLALAGVADQLADQPSVPINIANLGTYSGDPRSPFFDPAVLRDEQKNEAFVASSLANAREKLMTYYGGFQQIGGLLNPYNNPYAITLPLSADAGDSNIGGQILGGPAASPSIGQVGGGGIFDTILSVLPTVIQGAVQLAPTGLLGGSLQRAFTPRAQSSTAGVTPTNMAAPAAGTGGGGVTTLNNALQYALAAYAQAQGGVSANMGGADGVTVNMGGMVMYDDSAPSQNVQWPTNGNCGRPRTRYVDVTSAPGLFNVGCRGLTPVGQVVLQNPNGSRDLYMRVGKIIAPSQKALQRAARKLAKQAHCTVSSGGGGRRARRRYYRRRPR